MSEPPLRAAIIPVTPLQQNCTLLWCTKTMRGAFVDPGGDLPQLKAAASQAGVTIEKILLTHGHIDHCGSAGILAEELGVPIEGPHEADRYWIDRLAEDGAKYGIPYAPTGLGGVETYPLVFAELIKRGWSDANLAKLAGGNVLRALRGAEKVAASMKNEPAALSDLDKGK
jgi:glyoxylase-like metal-dependent hydrolase (beta-lactamase superfamily II)